MGKLILVLLFLGGCSVKPKSSVPGIVPAKMPGYQFSCHKLASVKSGQYCSHIRGTPNKTIWYFHGLGCQQDILQDPSTCMPKSAGEFENAFTAGVDNIKIITVSFGREWILDPFPPKYMNNPDANVVTFRNEVMKEIESIESLPKPWQAVGHSMGALNLATLALSYPSVFDKIVLAHPMIIACDPWAFVVGLKCVGGITLLGSEFTEDKWKTQVDPILRVKKAVSLPPTLVLACNSDQFKLVEGPKKFVAEANRSGLKANFIAYDQCTHFAPKAPLVLEFLK